MAFPALVMIAQHTAEEAFSRLIPWVAGLIGLVCIGAILISVIRRLMRGTERSSESFGLHDLRQLHASGQLTDDEFAKAKALIIERLRPQTPTPPSDVAHAHHESDGQRGPDK